MADKKEEKFPSDDFDLDNFNFDDETLGEIPKDKHNRSPSLKIAKSFAEGAKGGFVSPAFLKNLILGALPEGYKEAADLASSVGREAGNLYNEAARKAKPQITAFKRASSTLLRQNEKNIPKGLKSKLENWLKTDAPRSESMSAEDYEVKSQLDALFGYQMEKDAQDRTENQMRSVIEQKQHKEMRSSTIAIQEGVARLVGYQDSVTQKFQRKLIELQYRQVFGQKALLDITRTTAKDTLQYLQTITKNTGLPDAVKIQLSEEAHKMFRQKLIGRGQQLFSDYTKDFRENLTKRAKSKISSMSQSFGSGLDAGAQGMDVIQQIRDQAEFERQNGGDPDTLMSWAARMAGDEGAKAAGGWLGKKARKYTGRSERVNKLGHKLSYGINNMPGIVNNWAKSDTTRTGFTGWLEQLAKGFAPIHTGQNIKVGNHNFEDSRAATPFDNLAHRSLTEIIPGYLSRLLQSSEGIRTGKLPDRVVFNADRNRFTTQKQASKDITMSVLPDSVAEGLHGRTDAATDALLGGRSISEAGRKQLSQLLLKEGIKTGSLDIGKIRQNGVRGEMSPEVRRELEDLFSQEMDDQTKGKFAKSFRQLNDFMPFISERLNAYAHTGNIDAMRKSGLVKAEGRNDILNPDFLLNRYRKHLGESGAEDEGQDQNLQDDIENDAQPGQGRRLGNRIIRLNRGARGGHGNGPTPPGHNLPPMSAQFDSKALVESLTKLTEKFDSFQDLSKLEHLETIDRWTGEIYALLHSQVPFGAAGGGAPGGPAPGGRPGYGLLGALPRALGAVGRVGLRGARAYGRGVGHLYGGLFKGAKGAVHGAGRAVKSVFQVVSPFVQDVYVEGAQYPALFGKKIAGGAYKDVLSGKTIKSIKDIKGAVEDENGQIVLTVEDYAKGLVGKNGSAISFGLVGKGFSGLGKLYGKYLGGVFGLYGAAAKGALNTARFVKNKLFDVVEDVYVQGETEPRLLALLMRNGGYVTAQGKPVRKVSDITGDVFDLQGNARLTQEDIAKGLVDHKGHKFKSLGRKLLSNTIGVAGRAAKWYWSKAVKPVWTGTAKAVKGTAKFAGRTALGLGNTLTGGYLGKGFGVLKGKMGLGTEDAGAVAGGDDSKILSKIYSLLDRRLPKPKKRRKGSWEEQFAAEQNTKGKGDIADNKHVQEEGKRNPILGVLLALYGGFKWFSKKFLGGFSKLFKWLPKLIKGKDLLEDATDLIPGRKGKWLRKGGRALWKGAKFLGRHAGGLARGAARLGGMGLRAGAALAPEALGALSTGATAIGGAVASGASAVGGALATGAAAVGSVLTAPVVLAAAAVAAVGVAGYFAYKWFKGRLKPLQKVRMAQYGVDLDGDDYKDQCQKIFSLEESLKGAAKISPKAPATLTGQVDFAKCLEIFGIDAKNTKDVQGFTTWFNGRFKPVWLTHLTVLTQLSPGVSLAEVDDKMDDGLKGKFAQKTRFDTNSPNYPYNVAASPFPGIPCVTGTKAIDETIKEVVDKFADDAAKYAAKNAGGVGASGTVKNESTFTKLAKVAAMATPMGLAMAAGNAASKLVSKLTKDTSGKGGLYTSTVNPHNIQTQVKTDSLLVIRMRTYGMFTMDLDRLQQLMALERALLKETQIDAKGVAKLPADINSYWNRFATSFGCQQSNEHQRATWLYWFQYRFIPTFLNFCSSVHVANATVFMLDPWKALKPEQRLAVGQATVSSTANIEGAVVSVWQIDASPWPDDVSNTSVDSVDLQLKQLKSGLKQTTLPEPKAPVDKDKGKENAVKNQQATQQAAKAAADKAKQTTSGGVNPNSPPGFNKNYASNAGSGGSSSGGGGGVAGSGISPEAAAFYKSIPLDPDVKISDSAGMRMTYQEATAKGITDPSELAAFMAQTATESGGFKKISENLNYKTPGRLHATFPGRVAAGQDEAALMAGGPAAIAERVYGGRKDLGNSQPGDGYKYRGSGFIQLTGRANFGAASKGLGIDLVKNPELVRSNPKIAADTAVDWWQRNGAGKYGRAGDINAVRRLTNSGRPDGPLTDQKSLGVANSYYHKYLNMIKSGEMEEMMGKGGKGAGSEGLSDDRVGAGGTTTRDASGNAVSHTDADGTKGAGAGAGASATVPVAAAGTPPPGTGGGAVSAGPATPASSGGSLSGVMGGGAPASGFGAGKPSMTSTLQKSAVTTGPTGVSTQQTTAKSDTQVPTDIGAVQTRQRVQVETQQRQTADKANNSWDAATTVLQQQLGVQQSILNLISNYLAGKGGVQQPGNAPSSGGAPQAQPQNSGGPMGANPNGPTMSPGVINTRRKTA